MYGGGGGSGEGGPEGRRKWSDPRLKLREETNRMP